METNEVAVDEPVVWNGYYEKIFYRVHLSSGEIVQCWPNAGRLNAGDGSGRVWWPHDNVLVTVADNDEFGSDAMQERVGDAKRWLKLHYDQAYVDGVRNEYEKKPTPPPYQSVSDHRRAHTKAAKRERYLKKKR